MRIARITIKNFRGISAAELQFGSHTVFIGDNNTGKSSVLEAIDLVLGPDRISRSAPIDEHDFYASRYLDAEGKPVAIEIELVVTDLSSEQIRNFKGNLEFWDETTASIVQGPPINAIEAPTVKESLRVAFRGWYDSDDDDFKVETVFCFPLSENGQQPPFRTSDKRQCGFLFLRALRTGSRALSLERGSLLDIILRLRDIRPKMWEDVLAQLRKLSVADDAATGVANVLSGIQIAISEFGPLDWAADPHLRVSDLTREHLRKTLTVFMATGAKDGDLMHAAPYQHQGTGTINMLVLALLSMIADAKKAVIFAMEEPETAIPPSSQKSIVSGVRGKSSQALFTSHSPYVLEEFKPSEIIVLSRSATGILTGKPVTFPAHIKPKFYSSEFRLRFSEALLARRVLIAEGETETAAYPAAARKLAELDPQTYSSLEALSIAVFNAKTDSQIANYGNFFRDFGKVVFAVYDKQGDATQKASIEAAVDHPFESTTTGFEDLVLNETAESALRRFVAQLDADGEWPSHLSGCKPTPAMPLTEVRAALKKYLSWGKGSGNAGDLLVECSLTEMPTSIKDTLAKVKKCVYPSTLPTSGLTQQPQPGQPTNSPTGSA